MRDSHAHPVIWRAPEIPSPRWDPQYPVRRRLCTACICNHHVDVGDNEGTRTTVIPSCPSTGTTFRALRNNLLYVAPALVVVCLPTVLALTHLFRHPRGDLSVNSDRSSAQHALITSRTVFPRFLSPVAQTHCFELRLSADLSRRSLWSRKGP